MPPTWPDRIRRVAFEKTGGHCAYCVASLDWDLRGRCAELRPPAGAWEVSRYDPPDRCGGELEADDLANLVPGCCACIRDKGTASGDEFIAARRRRAGLS